MMDLATGELLYSSIQLTTSSQPAAHTPAPGEAQMPSPAECSCFHITLESHQAFRLPTSLQDGIAKIKMQ